ncbi:hypothetical protein HYC85_012145 [Camellia sinensis]|uniref:Uncharacterized protein n=1 Tax=Camellia sinensis TaxID=4442 RepID=A0A7J7HB38_CAMSI|nr:hypothetical protein HYC85_012145 [Camellia sinensis]
MEKTGPSLQTEARHKKSPEVRSHPTTKIRIGITISPLHALFRTKLSLQSLQGPPLHKFDMLQEGHPKLLQSPSQASLRGFECMGVNGSAEKWAVESRAGLEGEREDEGVESECERGVNVVEESEGLVVAALVDVGCVREPSVAAQNFGPSLERGVGRSSESGVRVWWVEPEWLARASGCTWFWT